MSAALFAAAAAFAPAAGRGQGISADEYERMFAPAPLEVAARMQGGVAVVTWSPAPTPPAGRLAYNRALSRYRVYRLVGDDQRVVAETRATSFVDRAPPPGRVRYVVAAVQRSGQEGARSDEAPLAR